MKVKVIVSLISATLIVVHLLWPSIRFDPATLVLLVLAILPWLSDLIKALELPGGFRIELQDVKAATDKFTVQKKELPQPGTSNVSEVPATTGLSTFERLKAMARQEPGLALVALRIELEKNLRAVAEEAGIPVEQMSAGQLTILLERRGRLSAETASGLRDLVVLGNRAAHGGEVTHQAAEWAVDSASTVLAAIEPSSPHRFLKVSAALEKLLLEHTGLSTLDAALNILQQKGVLSSTERSQLEDLQTVAVDIRFGFGDWDVQSVAKLHVLKELYDTLVRRLGERPEQYPLKPTATS